MPSLKGTETEQNLKDAVARESQANCRYLYFAQKADVEGFNVVAAVFRSTAERETGHAHGHLEYLEEVDAPATGKPLPKRARGKLEHDRRETWTQRLTRKRASARSCTGRQMLE